MNFLILFSNNINQQSCIVSDILYYLYTVEPHY